MPFRDHDPLAVAVRPGVFHFETGVLQVRTIRSGPNQFDGQIIRAALEQAGSGAALFFAGPAMTEEYPTSGSSLQHQSPLPVLYGLVVRLFAAWCRGASPKFVRPFLIHQQSAGQGHVESLCATQQSSVGTPY